MFRIREVASIDEEVTILTKALMKDMMIPVLERVVEVFGEMNDALRMAFHKTLEGLKALAGRIFLNPWFVIGTMPVALKSYNYPRCVFHVALLCLRCVPYSKSYTAKSRMPSSKKYRKFENNSKWPKLQKV